MPAPLRDLKRAGIYFEPYNRDVPESSASDQRAGVLLRLARWTPRLVALAVFLLLAIVHTWPLASNPAHLSRNDNGDALLNSWAIAWVAHQLPRDPLHLFDANIFYPERVTLGYSEAMIVQGVLAMPILAADGSPVLAFNLVLIAGFALTGWAFCLLLHRWTGSWGAGYCCGSLAAFNSHVLVRLPHLQAQHVEFVALILFTLDRLFTSYRIRDAAWLGVSFALQGLTSVYLLVFSTWMLLFAVLGRAQAWLRRDPTRMIGLFLVAAATATLLLAPYLLGYYVAYRLTGVERTIADARSQAGSWVDYLSTGSRLHYGLWSRPFMGQARSAAFPGVVAMALVGLALAWPETRRDARLRMCLIAAIGCAAVSMVPRTPIYPLLHQVIPLFKVVRVPSRLEQIVLLMIAVVAGFGVAGLAHRWRSSRTWPVAAAALCALVNLEALRAPFGYTPFSEIPPIYDWLASQRGAVIVELPFYPPPAWFRNAPYMLNSTRHWRPILNGYSGLRPGSYNDTYRAIANFPDVKSLAALHARGVTHIVVHKEAFSEGRPGRFDAIAGFASLQQVAESGDIHIYRLR
jgi:hypothetical protein